MADYDADRLRCTVCGNERCVDRKYGSRQPGSTVGAWCGCASAPVLHAVLGGCQPAAYAMLNVVCDMCGHLFRLRTGASFLPDRPPAPGTKLPAYAVFNRHECVAAARTRTYTTISAEQAASVRRACREAAQAHLVCVDCRRVVVVDRPIISGFSGRVMGSLPGHPVADRDMPHDCPGRTPWLAFVVVSGEAAGRVVA